MEKTADLAMIQKTNIDTLHQEGKSQRVITFLDGRAGYVVLMGLVSVTISYSFRCLTTETVKYTNENSFIENLASSKYSMWAQRGNKCNNK